MKKWFIAAVIVIGSSLSAQAQLLPVRGQTTEARMRTVALATDLPTLQETVNGVLVPAALREGEKVLVLRNNSSQSLLAGDVRPFVLIYSAVIGGTADGGFKFDAPGAGSERFIAADQTVADVKQFGAVGDGSADDSQEIQAAITAMGNKGGGLVVCPTGTYDINKTPINMASGVTLDGRMSTFEDCKLVFPSASVDITLRNLTIHKTTNDVIGPNNYHGIQTLAGQRHLIENIRFTVLQGQMPPIDGENALLMFNAVKCKLDNLYFGPNAGSMGVFLMGKDITMSNIFLDRAQDDDGIALKSTESGDCENWQLNNIHTRGSFAGISLGSQIKGFIRNITVTNLLVEDAPSVAFLKAGSQATSDTPISHLGGVIENVVINGFVFRTMDPTVVGAEHLFYLTARKNSTLRNVDIGNGIISARQKDGAASGSSFLRVQPLDEVGFTNTIENINIHDVHMVDSKDGINGTPATDGRHIVTGLIFDEDTPDAGISVVKNITIRNCSFKDLGGGFLIKAFIPTAATYQLSGLRLLNLTFETPSDNPLSPDYNRVIDVFDHAGIEISGLKVNNWSDESKLPGPVLADQEILLGAIPTGDAPTIATPRWMKQEEIRINNDASDIQSTAPIILRYRMPTRRYVARYEFVSKGFQNDATNHNIYIIRKDVATVKTSVTLFSPKDYSAFTSGVWYATANNLLSNTDVIFGTVAHTADAGTAPFTGYDNLRGEKSWFNAGDHLEIWRADDGFGQQENDLRLRISFLEF